MRLRLTYVAGGIIALCVIATVWLAQVATPGRNGRAAPERKAARHSGQTLNFSQGAI